MSTRVFENVTDENFNAFPETVPNHWFCGPEKVENDVKERRKERSRNKKDFVFAVLATQWRISNDKNPVATYC